MPRQFVELAVAILVLGLSIWGLTEALSFPGESAYMPAAVLILAIALSLIWIVQALLWLRKGHERIEVDPAEMRRLATLIALGLAYALAMPRIGFFTATAVFVPVSALALGYRGYLVLAIGTAAFIAVLYGVFSMLLRTPLPPELFGLLAGGTVA